MIKKFLCLSFLASALSFSTAAMASDVYSEKTACITMQGNGERYAALTGQLLRLLEMNVEPKAIFGGSSGSGISALIGAILDNESLQNTSVIVNGIELSVAQKAARLLAASSEPNATIIVFPALNQLGKTIRSAIGFVLADMFAKAYIGYPDQALAPIESSAGQISLLAEFFGVADFSAALTENDFARRQEMVMEQWLDFGELIQVTPKEFIRALVTAPSDSRWTERSEDIKKRYFDLYYSETTPESNSPDNARVRYNNQLESWKWLFNWISDDRLETVFLNAIKNFDSLPFISYTAEILSKPFYLPNGEKVIDAYHSRSGFGIPSRTIIHTTGRIAEPSARKGRVEKNGIENFYQVYFPGNSLVDDLLVAREEKAAKGESFIQYFDASSEQLKPVVDADHLVVVNQPLLAQAIKASIAEPNAFRRDTILMSEQDVANNSVVLQGDESLITFGGWMESGNATTLKSLSACKDVDFFVEVSNMETGGLFEFQLKAARAFIEGGWGSIVNGRNEDNASEESIQFMNNLWSAFDFGRDWVGEQQHVLLGFDWDNASGETGDLAEELNKAYDNNRSAMFVLSYQSAFNELLGDDLQRFPMFDATNVLNINLMETDLKAIKEVDLIHETVDELLGK